MSSIEIRKIGITKLDTDAVANAANTELWEGGGVCGYIFHDAGSKEMTAACQKIGHCDEGSAVIIPGFKLPAKYVIHAVGPRWSGGEHNEPKLLYSAYKQSLLLAKENGLHSIGFPLISAGISDIRWIKHGERLSRHAMSLFVIIPIMISTSFLRYWMTRSLRPVRKRLRESWEAKRLRLV